MSRRSTRPAARGWLIDNNYFHDGLDRGVGFKFGASGNIVKNNRFENLPGFAMSFGGGSSPHTYDSEANNLVGRDNIVTNVRGMLEVFSCTDCTFSGKHARRRRHRRAAVRRRKPIGLPRRLRADQRLVADRQPLPGPRGLRRSE